MTKYPLNIKNELSILLIFLFSKAFQLGFRLRMYVCKTFECLGGIWLFLAFRGILVIFLGLEGIFGQF